MPLPADTRLGVYEIVASLGSGGMGEVYRARDTRLGRDVAVKVLPADVSKDPDRLERFEREARAVAALNHPNIVVLHSIENAGECAFSPWSWSRARTWTDTWGAPRSRVAGVAIHSARCQQSI